MGHDLSIKQTFCEQLGEDLDAEVCAEVQRHLDDCPKCRAQYDSVKQTVHIYQDISRDDNTVPGDVQERLLKVLSLKPTKSIPLG